ncbi:MAG: type II secretion system F family protein [Pirellulales bacterium]
MAARSGRPRWQPTAATVLPDVRAVGRGAGVGRRPGGDGRVVSEMARQLLIVGEQTGTLPAVLRKLSSHYDHEVRTIRVFRAAIFWPLLQLAAAIAVSGLVIWIPEFIAGPNGAIDILGFGLVGTRGLAIYCGIVAAAVAAVYFLVRSIARDKPWARPILALVRRTPVIGDAIETMALSRLAWALQLALDAGVETRRALRLGISAAKYPPYQAVADQVTTSIRRGEEITTALESADVFPREFLDACDVGERSGRLPETFGQLSEQYEAKAQHRMAAVAVVAGFAVWGLVAVFIIVMIFRLFSFYVGILEDPFSV